MSFRAWTPKCKKWLKRHSSSSLQGHVNLLKANYVIAPFRKEFIGHYYRSICFSMILISILKCLYKFWRSEIHLAQWTSEHASRRATMYFLISVKEFRLPKRALTFLGSHPMYSDWTENELCVVFMKSTEAKSDCKVLR